MSNTRSAIAFTFLLLVLATMLGRVAYLQTLARHRIISHAERQQHQKETLYARRGSIFDRNGLLLAGTVQKQSLFIDPQLFMQHFQQEGRSLVDMDPAIERIATLVGVEPLDVLTRLGEHPGSRYIRIAAGLDETTATELSDMQLPGLGFEPTSARIYPMGSLAAHVLGGMQRDGLVGLEGIEKRFDERLAGRNGYKRSLKDARRRSIAVAEEDYHPPEHGQHLVLTIDANIQLIAQQELDAAARHYRAERAELVVMDPRTGEVLALVNWPFYSPQNLEDSKPETWRNRAIVDPYEPGSTIKPFIVGPALASGAVKVTDVLPVNGPTHQTSYGRTIRDVAGYPKLAVWDVLVKSSNIGMVMLVGKLGNDRLHAALTGWGFGKTTGIDLPGESGGLVNPRRKWTRLSPDSMAQGYELMLTPLQLARAMCSYANGGKLVTPRVVLGTLQPDGTIRPLLPNKTPLPQLIDPQTASLMRRILADVMVRGTGTKARSAIYNIFGKTGTSHTAVNGSYNDSHYNASFVGGAPYENPRLVIAVVVHNPDKSLAHYGGIIAAPTAQRVLDRALQFLGEPPSPDLEPPPEPLASLLYHFDAKAYSRRPSPAGLDR